MQLARTHHGFALLEALVALALLAFGLLGLLWMQQQALVSHRQQLMRAVATGLAEDLSQRMRLNAAQASRYGRSWGAGSTSVSSLDCAATPCSRSTLADWDMQQLAQQLQQQLPDGDATVFALASLPNWWGIVIAWADASESYRTDNASGSPTCPPQKSCWRLFFRPDR